MSRIIHLDLFSGMGGFALGLHQAGIVPTHHYFSEIDSHAIANYKYNFTNAIYIGSVTNVRHIIRTIDRKPTDRLIITFGSPCQDFSLAGRRAGIEGSKSSLIKFAIFLIRWLRPDIYIWENVKGAYSTNNGADFWGIVKAFANINGYRLEQQLVNTAWVLPQNRERIYLAGHLAERSQPGIFPFRETAELHNKRESQKSSEIASTLNALDHKSWVGNFIVKTNTSQGFEIANEGDSINFSNPNSKTRRGRVGKGVAQTLDTQANQGVIQVNPNLESGGKQPYQQNRVYDENGLTPALNAGKSDLIIKTGAIRGRGENNGGNEEEKHTILIGDKRGDEGFRWRKNGNAPTILGANQKSGTPSCSMLNTNGNIRRLTEIECERLQGFQDDWTKFGIYDTKKGLETKQIPKTQRYKMCGNAVTATIVKIIGQRIKFI